MEKTSQTAGTVAEDSSGAGQAAAYSGINLPTLGVPGFLVDGNAAIELSGSATDRSYVRAPGLFDPAATSFTLEALVQTDAIGVGQLIFQQLDSSGTGRSLLKVNASGVVDSFIGGATRASGISAVAGEPLHVVMVFERTGLSSTGEGEGTVIFYVNGVKGNSVTMSGSNGVEPSMGDFVIGVNKGLNGSLFNGVIDEVAFYDKALTGQSVHANAALAWAFTLISPPKSLQNPSCEVKSRPDKIIQQGIHPAIGGRQNRGATHTNREIGGAEKRKVGGGRPLCTSGKESRALSYLSPSKPTLAVW